VATSPTVVFTPCLANSDFAWYSIRSTMSDALSHQSVGRGVAS
jgi:hypothetical protein